MHRNERYFDKNEGKHNFFRQVEPQELSSQIQKQKNASKTHKKKLNKMKDPDS